MTADDSVGLEKVDIKLTDLKKPNGTDDSDDKEQVQLKVYPRRWLVLAVVALLNNSNTVSWIAFSPVSNHVNEFYGGSAATWFSMVYMMMTIPVGVFAMWAGGRFGTRSAILIAGWTNGIGALIRLVSAFLPMEYRFPVGISGQALAAVAYPFIMFLPTKVAGSWFPDTQRALATTIGVMSNPLGVLLANVIAPAMVTDPAHVPLLCIFTAVPAVIAMLLATFGVTRSEPKLPPAFSASVQQMDFLPGLKACMSNRQYLILLFVMGGGIGMFNCLYTVMQSLLCPSGYSNSFVGLCAALMIIGGVFGAAASGIFVDKTKLYEETMKVAMGLAVVFGLVFMQLTLHPDLAPYLAITCVLFGILGLATYPVGLELASECCYPASEATSTGLIVLSGQLQSVIYVMLMKQFARPLQPEKMDVQVCTAKGESMDAADPNAAKDNYQSVLVFSAIAGLLVLLLVTLFKPVYKRIEAERNRAQQADKETSAKGKVTLDNGDSVTEPLNA